MSESDRDRWVFNVLVFDGFPSSRELKLVLTAAKPQPPVAPVVSRGIAAIHIPYSSSADSSSVLCNVLSPLRGYGADGTISVG